MWASSHVFFLAEKTRSLVAFFNILSSSHSTSSGFPQRPAERVLGKGSTESGPHGAHISYATPHIPVISLRSVETD